MNKLCTKCKQSKPIDKFSPDKRASDGKTSQCRECMSDRRKNKYKDAIVAYIFPD